MPICLNLLADAQAAEELRRRDPVKRSLWTGGLLISLVLFWCLVVQARIITANSEFSKHERRWKAIEKKHAGVTDDLKKTAGIEGKLSVLRRLSTNRFLWGSTMNALQQTVVEQVQAVSLKTVQSFTYIEPVTAKTNSSKMLPSKPAVAVEKIAITLEAKDWNPADQNYNKLKEAIAKFPSFQTNFSKSDALRLTSLSKPSLDPNDASSPFVRFTLEMQFPEVRRHE